MTDFTLCQPLRLAEPIAGGHLRRRGGFSPADWWKFSVQVAGLIRYMQAVKRLTGSISKVGLLNPITVDQEHTLIAGLHRLEAAKLLGWSELECTVSSLGGLQSELAEIDENLIRRELDLVDESEQLARRKEIYEALYPWTKRGAKNQYTQNKEVLTDTVTVSKKSLWLSLLISQRKVQNIGLCKRYNEAMKRKSEGTGHGEEKAVSPGDIHEGVFQRGKMPGVLGKFAVVGWVCLSEMRLPTLLPADQWSVPMRRVSPPNLGDSRDGTSQDPYATDAVVFGILLCQSR